MKYLICVAISFFYATTFTPPKAQNKGFSTISGAISGLANNSLIKLIALSGRTIDSCYLKNDKFSLRNEFMLEAGPLRLSIFKNSIEKNAELFIGNENIIVSGNIDNFPSKLIVTGSPNHNLMLELDKILSDVVDERRDLLSNYISSKQSGKMNDSIKNIYWGQAGSIKMLDEEKMYRQKKFIEKNLNSYYSIYLLSLIKSDYEKAELQRLMNKLREPYKSSIYANAISTFISARELTIGGKYISFIAFDRNDKAVTFSDYFTGKYVLLEFSTPYCQFSLQATEPLKKLLRNNSGKIDIVTFYVDEEKSGYSSFLNKIQKPWNVIWDKKGRFGKVYSMYNIYSTPTFFLFDTNGILIEKDDGFDEKFMQKIQDIIQ